MKNRKSYTFLVSVIFLVLFSTIYTSSEDTIGPSPELQLFWAHTENTVTAEIWFWIDFQEPIKGFTPSDIKISGDAAGTGTYLAAFEVDELNQVYPDGVTYFAILKLPNATEGRVRISIPENVLTDAADNPNTASNVMRVFIDMTVPGVRIEPVEPDPQNSPFFVDIKVSEPVLLLHDRQITVDLYAGSSYVGNASTTTTASNSDTDKFTMINNAKLYTQRRYKVRTNSDKRFSRVRLRTSVIDGWSNKSKEATLWVNVDIMYQTDINRDNKTNANDLIPIVKDFGKWVGGPGIINNPLSDVNGDGRINEKDLRIVVNAIE